MSDIELGGIYSQNNATCTLTTNSRFGDACARSDTTLGKIKLKGSEGRTVQIKVIGVSNEEVEFTPILTNGIQEQQFSLLNNAEIYIGGELKVVSAQNSDDKRVIYRIEVNYQ